MADMEGFREEASEEGSDKAINTDASDMDEASVPGCPSDPNLDEHKGGRVAINCRPRSGELELIGVSFASCQHTSSMTGTTYSERAVARSSHRTNAQRPCRAHANISASSSAAPSPNSSPLPALPRAVARLLAKSCLLRRKAFIAPLVSSTPIWSNASMRKMSSS